VTWRPTYASPYLAVSVLLSRRVAQGSDTSVFALAPILLLLHEDTILFQSLTGSQRYAPPLVGRCRLTLSNPR